MDSFFSQTRNGLTYLTAPNISVPHAFTTRHGKPCGGKFSEESMTALCNALDISPGNIIFNKQVHGNNVTVVTDKIINCRLSIHNSSVEADALITNMKETALMVFTADCIPVLLFDPQQNAIGAVHAGWRGTAEGIAAETVSAMTNEYGSSPADIYAAIGPGISKCCFETGGDTAGAMYMLCKKYNLPESFINKNRTNNGKYMIDLKEASRLTLLSAGLLPQNICVSLDCTACTANRSGNRYWSHRRHGTNRSTQSAVILIDN